ncbi:hydrogenase maturation protease [Rippkaea orientalis PCC 8801]|uniref:Hydrogenase maturation protease n=1 Tax=Rippkaea orientalis (strain PCC 8801 / RF-1) TaxID=41431 RepID=B7JZG0_RIPO1|nr:hydrogenase maturation protease [Rippkaea orientalis]ACK64120.1 hydrogenase maturation protease [Rippkaea orientalis PCC 8801]
MSKKCLIIGYGNSLRSDDGAGQKVAKRVAQWNLKNVSCIAIYQLTPELSEAISKVDMVIFVDALATSKKLEIQQLKVNSKITNLGHYSNPSQLLSLTKAIYNKLPIAYWILIPAINFDFGESLSIITENAIKLALEKIRKMIL